MLAKFLDLAIEQLKALVRRRTRDAVREAVLDGVKDAFSEMELSIDLEATVIHAASSVQVIEQQRPALPAMLGHEQPQKRKRGRPRKHMNYENSKPPGS